MSGSLLKRFLLASGGFFFRFRNAVFPAVFAFLFLFIRPTFFLGVEPLDHIVMVIGAFTAFTGQAFRLFVIGFAYIKRGGVGGRVYADDLVVKGVFAHTRNPMYVGNFLIFLGLGMMYGSPFVYFAVIPFFSFVYYTIVVAEEQYLKQRFGIDYDIYTRNVNRFIPNFKGMRRSLSEFHYDWKRVIRKDYGTIFGTLFGVVVISFWKSFRIVGIEKMRQVLLPYAVLTALLLLLYAAARYLKKTGRLVS